MRREFARSRFIFKINLMRMENTLAAHALRCCNTRTMNDMNPPKDRKTPPKGKIRQNLTLSPETAEMLQLAAKREDVSMSALISRWIREDAKKNGSIVRRNPLTLKHEPNEEFDQAAEDALSSVHAPVNLVKKGKPKK